MRVSPCCAALRTPSRERARVKASHVHNERRSSIIESAGPRNCTHLTGRRLFVQFQPPGIDSERADEPLAFASPIKAPPIAKIANSFLTRNVRLTIAHRTDTKTRAAGKVARNCSIIFLSFFPGGRRGERSGARALAIRNDLTLT